MNIKSKIALSVSIILIVLSVAILTIAAVWAATQQSFKTTFNVNYTAMQVSGSATAQWKVGSGPWQDMTTNGDKSGATTVTFGAQVNENAALMPTQSYIDLSSENPYIVFKYKFTNTGDNDYAIDLFYEDPTSDDANMSVFTYNAETELSSADEKTISSNFGDWTTTSISAGKTRYVYILASITDKTSNANYSGSFSFALDGKNYADVLDFTPSTGTITGLNKNTEVLRIPSTIGTQSVTAIKAGAFADNTTLKEVIIPDSVQTIGLGAFNSGCTNLKYISIPFVGKNATTTTSSEVIFGYIFGASSYSSQNSRLPTTLTNVIITGGTSIGSYAFRECSGLTSITIPEGVTSIGSSAFYNCIGLTGITIPSSVTSIGVQAFYYCSGLTSITILSSVESIGSNAFQGCRGLTSLTIPSSVESIGNYAFYSCSGLKEVIIDSVYAYNTATAASSVCGYLLNYITTKGETVKVLKSIVDDSANTNNYLNNNTSVFTRTTSADGKYYIYTYN